MRFLLINPYCPISETPSPPLGLSYLSAVLERAGVEVKVLDFVVFPYSKKVLEEVLNDFSPQAVGITAVTMTFDSAVEVVKDIKSLDQDLLTIMGGPHVSFCAEETLMTLPELDIIVLGEGEETITELVREVGNRRNWRGVKGIAYRDGAGTRKTGFRDYLPDVDALPVPARHLIPLGRYRALRMPISMTTSRGCPFKCIFCLGKKMVGSSVRYRDPEKVVDELESLSHFNFHQVNLADDLFTANRTHCLDICREITRRELNVGWAVFARVDCVSRGLLSKMKEAGCRAVCFGCESANPGILETIKKGIVIEQFTDAAEMCLEVGITPHASFILGLPGETPETLEETINFGTRLKEMGIGFGFHILAPFPGTEVREDRDRLGIRILTDDWSQYDANRSVVETPSVTKTMLDRIVVDWENAYNEWLGEIARRMEKGEATQTEASELTGLERIVMSYELMMGNVIEDHGTWYSGAEPYSEKHALKSLAGRIARNTRHAGNKLIGTLLAAVEQGNLQCTRENGHIRWRWVDYL